MGVSLKMVQEYCWWWGNNTKIESYKKSKKQMVKILSLLKEIILKPKIDGNKTDGDKADGNKTDSEETDDKQPDITDMPDLESKESAEQRRKQKGENSNTISNAK